VPLGSVGLALCVLVACAKPEPGSVKGAQAGGSAQVGEAAACPAHALAPARLPRTLPEHETLAYWLARYTPEALDAPLLSTEQIAGYNAALGRRPSDNMASQRDLLEPIARGELVHDLHDRLSYLRERIEGGRLVDDAGQQPSADALAGFASEVKSELSPTLRVALADVQMRCGPFPAALLEPGAAIRYDRNACSTIRAQEPVRVIAPFGAMLLAETRYARGFIPTDAALSAPLTGDRAQAVVHGPRAIAREASDWVDGSGAKRLLPAGTLIPLAGESRAWLGSTEGVAETALSAQLTPVARPLTRRALLTEAFSFLGAPYGFGDAQGGRDCSRLMLDLFERFDLALPRHSGWQAQAGSYRLDVSKLNERDKLAALREVSARGAVMLTFPGHIMLHLGARTDGAQMVLHALGEYAVPCAAGDKPSETVFENKRVVVSDLEVGRGSARKALIERITTFVVFGEAPSGALAAQVKLAPALPLEPPPESAPCGDALDARIFTSPLRPEQGQPLRVIATGQKPSAQSELWLFDPEGKRVRAGMRRLGGPPHSVWIELSKPREGRYTALWSDAGKPIGCKRIAVRVPQKLEPSTAQSVWEPRFRWEADTNNLWAAFVEQLFDDPPDDERTWTSLHELLRDRDRNLLHDHFGLGEEERFDLVPDCADLPFALRAYFAWKLKLPFAYRQCSRGRAGIAPTCGELHACTMTREAPDDVGAFGFFVNRRVRSGVHSASGRTAPNDDATDLYPVALDRASLPPGTVFADPYGHVLILTRWIAQGHAGPKSYGILMAAEAQPDNTVGRRRFFRGSFLFDPSTEDVGAGFKAFRPLTFDRASNTITALDNQTLATTSEHARFSSMQYEGSRDDFYDRMDALINPQPLDPSERLRSLLDSFQESVERRVLSIDTGEAYQRGKSGVIPMPIGHEVFETTGPWEDYSTPSRDLRLLIALDELLALPKRVAAQPERFALAAGEDPTKRSAALAQELQQELARRSFTYTRSDGSPQRLPLSAVVERAAALEVAYNPNDCPETRWGAPAGSTEAAPCKRAAPAEQRARLERYRVWFNTRTRPARGARAP
jgi:hypothetical protein